MENEKGKIRWKRLHNHSLAVEVQEPGRKNWVLYYHSDYYKPDFDVSQGYATWQNCLKLGFEVVPNMYKLH